MLFKKLATSTTWGSFATFSIIVRPSDIAAAIITAEMGLDEDSIIAALRGELAKVAA